MTNTGNVTVFDLTIYDTEGKQHKITISREQLQILKTSVDEALQARVYDELMSRSPYIVSRGIDKESHE